MNPVRKQRLLLVLLLVAGVGIAVALALFALKENINHYFSPAQMASGEAPIGQKIRGGGVVVPGTVKRDPESLKVIFRVSDGDGDVEVEYTGILPDLFKEGQGIVGTGKLDESRRFVAEELLAKHDENYMPPEVQKAIDKAHGSKSGDKSDKSYGTPSYQQESRQSVESLQPESQPQSPESK
ncbi:cytochrome c maturation protein CcmE [Endozoicomonas numazuensis]|uniref:cytochrome c maturation protein CcmE n=1 Tax=Endozoicomonas numazuensis TaxID=1137799 RepID=UPI00068A86EB|nr:cytochrome c maturation protein CcmE [Endozoicomonas numazuensis]